jgi:RNA polymerase sigma factor (sigma-70 family)
VESRETASAELVPNADEVTGRLVEAVRAGDLAAFGKLYRDHAPAVRAVAASRIPDPGLADDAVQEVFARALAALPSLREVGRFRPWLMSIARHVALDALRAKGRAQPLDDQMMAEIPSVEPGPAELAELAELADLVRGVVGGLSQRDATTVGLIRLGFSVEDVATALGVSHVAAKVALHRARRRLRDALVFQVMVRTGGAACAEFRALREDGGAQQLTAHVRLCETCSAAARAHALG